MEPLPREWRRYVPVAGKEPEGIIRNYYLHIPSGKLCYTPTCVDIGSIYNNRPEGPIAFILAHGWRVDPGEIPPRIVLPLGI